jgi:hypothetical protein
MGIECDCTMTMVVHWQRQVSRTKNECGYVVCCCRLECDEYVLYTAIPVTGCGTYEGRVRGQERRIPTPQYCCSACKARRHKPQTRKANTRRGQTEAVPSSAEKRGTETGLARERREQLRDAGLGLQNHQFGGVGELFERSDPSVTWQYNMRHRVVPVTDCQ